MNMALHFLKGSLKGEEHPISHAGETALFVDEEGRLSISGGDGFEACAVITAHKNRYEITALTPTVEIKVNRQAVVHHELAEGDRINILKTTIMLVALTRFNPIIRRQKSVRAKALIAHCDDESLVSTMAAQKSHPAKPKAHPTKLDFPQPEPNALKSFCGLPSNGPLHKMSGGELLRRICHPSQNVNLALKNNGVFASLYIRDGNVLDATLTSHPAWPAQRVFNRVYRWTEGTYDLESTAGELVDRKINLSLEKLFAEAEQEAGQIEALTGLLSPMTGKLTASTLKASELKKLAPAELFVLGLARIHGSIQGVMDNFSGGDVQACNILMCLMEKKALQAPA
jgi:hypothetical protein